MSQKSEVKTTAYEFVQGSYALSDSLQQVIVNISSSYTIRETPASREFTKQVASYVRAQG
jgi:hypothetical protein